MADFHRIPTTALIQALVNMATLPTPKDSADERCWRTKHRQIEDEIVRRNRFGMGQFSDRVRRVLVSKRLLTEMLTTGNVTRSFSIVGGLPRGAVMTSAKDEGDIIALWFHWEGWEPVPSAGVVPTLEILVQELS